MPGHSERVQRRSLLQDMLRAGVLVLVLGAAWAWRDWAGLSRLRLPDTDDVVRLQQIRDWLGGQRFADLTQHRFGAGVPMHWSRLADLAPAGLVLLLRPMLGSHAAELAAVIAWPLILFAAALALVARIARAAGGEGLALTAMVVAALAYPATTIFTPGRIDHHGLQVVLLLGATLAALGPAMLARGAAAGALAAASLVIGLETAPLLATVGGVLALDWIMLRPGGERRLAGFALGALAGLVAGRLVFASDAWRYPACDAFTADAWRAAMILAAAVLVLPLLLRRLASAGGRLAAATAIGGGAVAAALLGSPDCLAPYGGLDPVVAHWWLGQVEEAQPLFAAPLALAVGYGGLIVAGIAATALALRHAPSRGWAVLLALQLAALAVTLVQLRGAYAGAMLAAPGLAALIAVARRRGIGALAGAWLGSAGMLYPIAAQAITPRGASGAAQASCADPAVIDRLAALPPGALIAPIDTGAWALGATRLQLVGAPYHRDNAGNRAVIDFFRGDPTRAHAIAARWSARYVLLCDGDAAVFAPGAASMTRAIESGRAPAWLRPLLSGLGGVRLFEVRR